MDDSLLLPTVAAVALIVGLALGWAVYSAFSRRKLTREQDFFGLPGGSECVLVTHRDSAAPTGASRAMTRWRCWGWPR